MCLLGWGSVRSMNILLDGQQHRFWLFRVFLGHDLDFGVGKLAALGVGSGDVFGVVHLLLVYDLLAVVVLVVGVGIFEALG